MWEKYNRWLIDCSKKARTNEEELTVTNVLIVSFMGLSFITTALPVIIHMTISFIFAGLVLYTALSGKSFPTKIRALDVFGYHLHFFFPGTAERNVEIEEYLNKMLKFQGENPLTSNLFMNRPYFKIIEKHKLKSWVRTFIGKEKTIYYLIEERVLGLPHLREGILYWSQLLPKELLTFDDFKLLLLINPIKNKEHLWSLNDFSETNISLFFKNYNSSELKRLFTSSFYLSDYLEVLNIAERYNLILDKRKDMEDLRAWAQMMEAAYRGDRFHFPAVSAQIKMIEEMPTSLGVISTIDNLAKLEWWARALNNCLLTYQNKALDQEGHLFGIYQDGKPWAAFYINKDLFILEFKRKANAEVSHDNRHELERVLRQIRGAKR